MEDLADLFDLSDPNPEAMTERARRKLAALEGGAQLAPAGWFVGRIVLYVIFALCPSIALLYAAQMFYFDPEYQSPVAAALFLAPGLLIFTVAILRIMQSRASTPRNALRLFYGLQGRGRTKAATRLVLPADLDGFPRWFPEFRTGGPSPTMEADAWFFDARGVYSEYWRQLLRWPVAGYCITQIKNLEVEEITPDVRVCRFNLRLGINSQLWVLLILVPYIGILVVLIVDALTRKRFSAPMTKILVRAEDEWLLFNGAFQEADETNVAWL